MNKNRTKHIHALTVCIRADNEILHLISISLSFAPTTDGLDMHAFPQKTYGDNGPQHLSLSVLFNCSIYPPITPGHQEVTGLNAHQ